MALEDLLALLPDNDTGEIDAADMREVTTGLWNHADETGAETNQVFAVVDSGTGYDVPAEPPAGVTVRHFYGPDPFTGDPWPGVLDVYTATGA